MTLFLVTGGAGFIGSHIVKALRRGGARVRVLDDLSSGSLDNLAGFEVGEAGSGAEVELVRGDLRDEAPLAAACAGAAGVFHEAALVSVPQSVSDPLRCYDINVTGTLRLLEAARRAGIRRLVFAASSAAYGDDPVLPKQEDATPQPRSPYAASKVAGEHLLAAYGLCYGMRTVALRYFNVYGERQRDDSPYTGVIALFARALLEGRQVTIHGDGEQTRDFTYVDDAVAANLSAMERDIEPGLVINVGGGERVTINDLYATLAQLCGSDIAARHGPPREGDVRHSLASLDRARAVLSYQPKVRLRDGLERTLEWYRQRRAPAR